MDNEELLFEVLNTLTASEVRHLLICVLQDLEDETNGDEADIFEAMSSALMEVPTY